MALRNFTVVISYEDRFGTVYTDRFVDSVSATYDYVRVGGWAPDRWNLTLNAQCGRIVDPSTVEHSHESAHYFVD